MAIQASKKRRKESKNPKEMKKPKVDDPLEKVKKLTAANYFMTIDNLENLQTLNEMLNLVNVDQVLCLEKVGKGKQYFVAFNAAQESKHKSEAFGIILGPNTETESDQISEFYRIWGRKHCKLRRFPDGSTHETIALNNASGPLYMPLVKLQHLFNVHHPAVTLNFHHLHPDTRFEHLKAGENLSQHRRIVSEFCSQLRTVCQDQLPLRKVEPICSCLYNGSDIKEHCHQVKHGSKNGQIRIKSNLAPSKLNALNVHLEITQKEQMSDHMFARLKMAYAIKLKQLLTDQLKSKCQLVANGDIWIIHDGLMFALKFCKSQSNSSQFQLQDKLALLALHHPSLSGLFALVKQWLDKQYLSKSIDELVIALLLASIVQDGVCNTVENGFLKFLKVLSFTDFNQNCLSLSGDRLDSKLEYDFKTNRAQYPALTILDELDTKSSWSQSLNPLYLTRLVNCARMTLHKLCSDMNLFSNFDSAFSINSNVFDAVLVLNHYQIPTESAKSLKKTEKSLEDEEFPVVNYDPLQDFWNELTNAFGQQVQLYCCEKAARIAFKFNDIKEAKSILEDVQVLGKELIKECVTNSVC